MDKKSKYKKKTKLIPKSVPVTIDGKTLHIKQEDAVNEDDWMTIKEFEKMLDKLDADLKENRKQNEAVLN